MVTSARSPRVLAARTMSRNRGCSSGSPSPMKAIVPPGSTPSATASNAAHSMKPSGSSQECRTQVAQARLQALVGST